MLCKNVIRYLQIKLIEARRSSVPLVRDRHPVGEREIRRRAAKCLKTRLPGPSEKIRRTATERGALLARIPAVVSSAMASPMTDFYF